MPLTDAQLDGAVEAIDAPLWALPYRHANAEKKRLFAKRVFEICDSLDPAQYTQEGFDELVFATLQADRHYDELVSFIPVWLVWMVIEFVVKLLIDYWLRNRSPSKTRKSC